MKHEPDCTDADVVVQPQLGRGLPVVATCRTCGAIEIRKPAKHITGEVCKPHLDHCCEPDRIPRQWKPPQPRKKNAPRQQRPTPTTTTEDTPDATPI